MTKMFHPQFQQKVLEVILAILFFAGFLFIMPTACGYHEAKGNPPVVPDSSAKTFADIDTLVIQPHCAACHGTFEPLDYATVMNYVTPGDHAGSRFFEVLDTGYMPKRKGRLDQGLIDAVAGWIDAGAVK